MSDQYIYFIQADENGPIKIGTTQSNPLRRMANLQTGCPSVVRLLGAIEGTPAQERQIHAVLSQFRTHGEWFIPHPIVLAAVELAINCGKSVPFVPKKPKSDNEASAIIDLLGGNGPVAKLNRTTTSAVSNWRAKGSFPANTFLIFETALAKHNKTAPVSLWRMAPGRRAS